MLAAVFDAALDHVGIQRSLHQEGRARHLLARDLLEHPDELLADRLALHLGVGDARQAPEEPVGGLHVHQRDPEVPRERLLHLIGLALAVQPVVDEHARQLVPHRAVHQQCRHRGVDAAAQRAQHLLADPPATGSAPPGRR